MHRDLKPANVFITREGVVKILDFGLARPAPLSSDAVTRPVPVGAETEPGTVLGTVGYMSPEQVKGAPADSRSDIFSLGCILYEMLTGTRAFGGETAAETLAGILRDHPADVSESARKVPPNLAPLVRRCLEKDQEYRFQSARDLAFALRAAITGSTLTDEPVSSQPPRSQVRMRLIAAAAAVLAVVVSVMALDVGGLHDRLTGNGAHARRCSPRSQRRWLAGREPRLAKDSSIVLVASESPLKFALRSVVELEEAMTKPLTAFLVGPTIVR